MTDRMLLGDVQILGRGPGNGAVVFLNDQYDMGAPVPDVTEVVSQFLDGGTVTGRRSGNRTISLSLTVIGGSRSDRRDLISRIALTVDQQMFAVLWAPDDNEMMVFDCFRGSISQSMTVDAQSRQITVLTVRFSASPFGRSLLSITIPVIKPTVQLQSFDGVVDGGTVDAAVKSEGTASNRYHMQSYTYYDASVTRTVTVNGALLDLSNSAGITLQVKHVADLFWNQASAIRLDITLTLRWAGGQEVLTGDQVIANGNVDRPFTLLTFSKPQTAPLASLTGYTITAVTQLMQDQTGYSGSYTADIYFDDLRSQPGSASAASTARAIQLNITGVYGTARTPANLAITRAAGMLGVLIHSPSPRSSRSPLLLPLDGTGAPVAITSANTTFDGTYTPVLVVGTYSGTAPARTVSIVVSQYLRGGGFADPAVTVSRTYVQADSPGRLLVLPAITLPIRADAVDGAIGFRFEITTSGGPVDTFTELLLLDTEGQTVITTSNVSFQGMWIDEPKPARSIGIIYTGPTTSRSQAISAMRSTQADTPLSLNPGINGLLVVCPEGVPVLDVSYLPRWLTEPT